MSLEITNQDILENSPVGGSREQIRSRRYSNATANSLPSERIVLKKVELVKPRVTAEQIRNVQNAQAIKTSSPKQKESVNVAPIVQTEKKEDSSKEKSDNKVQAKIEAKVDTNVNLVDTKKFYQNIWFIGLLVGAIGGFVYAKLKNKNILTSLFFGGAIGGGLGFGYDKMKDANPNKSKSETASTTGDKSEEFYNKLMKIADEKPNKDEFLKKYNSLTDKQKEIANIMLDYFLELKPLVQKSPEVVLGGGSEEDKKKFLDINKKHEVKMASFKKEDIDIVNKIMEGK